MSDEHNANTVRQTPYQPNSAKPGRSIGDKLPADGSRMPPPWGATHAHPEAGELPVARTAPEHPTVPVAKAEAPQPRANCADDYDYYAEAPVRPAAALRSAPKFVPTLGGRVQGH